MTITKEQKAMASSFFFGRIRELKDGDIEVVFNCGICRRLYKQKSSEMYGKDETKKGHSLEVAMLDYETKELVFKDKIGVCNRCYLNYKNRPREERLNPQDKRRL
jgi:hypothetical protein